jgi:hypothetical protein
MSTGRDLEKADAVTSHRPRIRIETLNDGVKVSLNSACLQAISDLSSNFFSGKLQR